MDINAATQDDGEMLVIRHTATCAAIEHTVLAAFLKVEDLLIADRARQPIVDDDLDEVVNQVPVKVEPLKLEKHAFEVGGRVTPLTVATDANHAEIVSCPIREILAHDTYISTVADYYGIALNDRIQNLKIREVDVIQFKIKLSEFANWRVCHEGAVGSKLVYKLKFTNKKGPTAWTYLCQCYGYKKEQRRRTPGGKSGKTRNIQQATIKLGCPAKIIASETLEDMKEKSLSVKLYYHHNHALTSLENTGTAQKSERIKATIKSLLLQGSSIRSVMERLTFDYDRFMAIVRGNGQQLSQDNSDFITYEDVYNIWLRINTVTMRKDTDASLSAMKWLEEIEGNGGFAFYNRADTSKGVYYGFATEWQLRQLRDHGQSLWFDRTRNVFGTESSILTAWLQALCEKMKQMFSTPAHGYNYKPNAVITDQGNTESLAIKTVFPGIPILYSAWHVLKAWKREIRLRMTGVENLTTKEKIDLKDKVRLDLRAILYEKDKTIALHLIAKFRVRYGDQEKLLTYFSNNYFGGDPLVSQSASSSDDDDDVPEDEDSTSAAPVLEDCAVIALIAAPLTRQQRRELHIVRKQELWMFCYRQELSYASIDTNDYIESWHNTVKQHFDSDEQQLRVDTAIYVLNVMAVSHYQQKYMWSLANVDRMNAERRDEAEHLQRVKDHLKAREDNGQSQPTLYQLTADLVRVESLTTPGIFYLIKIDFTRVSTGQIVSCSCPAFQKEETYCKHISLLILEIPLLNFLKVDREDIHDGLDPLTLVPEADHVQQTLQSSVQVPVLGLSYYIDRINRLEALRDKEKPLPQEQELCSRFARFLEIFEATFPRKEVQDRSNNAKEGLIDSSKWK
ncbi:hypothetical protein BG004_007072 [Podila humilis]|nr:hypothetical protein BG004_007072 [Podila humilis]